MSEELNFKDIKNIKLNVGTELNMTESPDHDVPVKKKKKNKTTVTEEKPALKVLREIKRHENGTDGNIRNTKLASELRDSDDIVSYCIPSSSLKLNNILGGGLPNGFSEIYAEESNYKSTMSYDFIKHAQRAGLAVLLIETESSIQEDNIQLLENVGVDLDNLVIKKTKIVEDSFEYVDWFIQKAASVGFKAFVVIDSLGNMVSKKELEKGYDAKAGLPERAKTINYCIRLLSNTVEELDSCILIINHSHEVINMNSFPGARYGGPKSTTPGGKFLKFVTRVRMTFKKADKLKEGSKAIGVNLKATTVKNKITTDGQSVMIPIKSGYGVMIYKELADIAIENKIVKKKGGVLVYGEESFRGSAKLEFEMKRNKQLYKAIKKDVLFDLRNE